MPGPLLEEIRLVTTPCFGKCPVFDITLRPSSYVYRGEMYVTPLGEYEGKFSPHDFKRIERLVHELGLIEMADRYPVEMDDIPATITTFVFAGKLKKRIHNEGSRGPDRLWAFENLIEKLVLDHVRAQHDC